MVKNIENRKDYIQNILNKYFREFSHEYEYRYLSHGIAIDPVANQGVQLLNNSGPYDEIISGSSWLNHGVFRYKWSDIPGEATTPQLLLIYSNFDPIISGINIADIRREDELLYRAYGSEDIIELYDLSKSISFSEMANHINL